MIDQLSPGMISAIDIYNSPEDRTAISIDPWLTLALQQLENDKVHNLKEKEQTIMRDGDLATMMQEQEEDEAQKLMEK